MSFHQMEWVVATKLKGVVITSPEIRRACKAVIKPERIQEPVAENSAKYEKVYELYKKLYPALKDGFKELSCL